MNYKQFSEHTETFEINGIHYKVTANFVTNVISVQWANNGYMKLDLRQYEDFEGDMKEFVGAHL